MASLEDLTTDQLLARARELESQNALFQTLSSNPKTREMLQRAIKTVKPEISIPEIDKEDKVMAALAEEKKEREKFQNEFRERVSLETVQRQRDEAVKTHKLTSEQLTEVEKMLVDKDSGVHSYDAAARLYLASRTPSVPTPAAFSPPTFQMPEKEVWAKGIGNPSLLNKIAMDQAFEVMNELRSGKTTAG